jgi:hypothetical protein
MMMMMTMMIVLMGVQEETGVFVAVCSSCRWWVTPTATSGDSLCCCYCTRVGPICFSTSERANERARERERSASTEGDWKRSSSPSLSLSLAKCSLWMILGPTRVISHPSAPYRWFSVPTRVISHPRTGPGGWWAG